MTKDELDALVPGDVVTYETKNRHCHEGMAVLELSRDGTLVAYDTYWLTGRNMLTRDELEGADMYFRASEFEPWRDHPLNRWPTRIEDFAEQDRRILHRQGWCTKEHYVRRGAQPDLPTQIANAEHELEEARQDARSATSRLDECERILAELRSRAAQGPDLGALPVGSVIRSDDGNVLVRIYDEDDPEAKWQNIEGRHIYQTTTLRPGARWSVLYDPTENAS